MTGTKRFIGFLIAISIVFVTTAAAFAANGQSTNYNTYTNEYYGFSLQYPKSWGNSINIDKNRVITGVKTELTEYNDEILEFIFYKSGKTEIDFNGDIVIKERPEDYQACSIVAHEIRGDKQDWIKDELSSGNNTLVPGTDNVICDTSSWKLQNRIFYRVYGDDCYVSIEYRTTYKPSDNTIKDQICQIYKTVKFDTDNTQTKPDSVQARPTTSAVYVDGKKMAFEAYNINGNNYFKLRDIAMAITGTSRQFDVSWDSKNNAIKLTAGCAYTPNGTEMKKSADSTVKTAVTTTSKVYLGDDLLDLSAYNIDSSNYFMLRDIGKTMHFNVTWDGKNNAILIDTTSDYIG